MNKQVTIDKGWLIIHILGYLQLDHRISLTHRQTLLAVKLLLQVKINGTLQGVPQKNYF